MLAGLVSLVLLVRRRYRAVRLTAAAAVVALLGGWAAAQWPYLLPGVTVADAAATPAVLTAVLWALPGGAVLLVPSLALLFTLFQREHTEELASGVATGNPAQPSGGSGTRQR